MTEKRVGARPFYEHCAKPRGRVRFDVVQSGPIEIAFGGPSSTRDAFVEGAPFKRVHNVERPGSVTTYFRLIGAAADADVSYQGWKTASEKRKTSRRKP